MNIQTIITAIIIFSAIFYAGLQVYRKARSFSVKKKSCGAGCGCSAKA